MNTRKFLHIFLFIACFAISFALPQAGKANVFVQDGAKLFYTSDWEILENQAQEIYEEHGIGVYTVIVPEVAVKTEKELDDHVFKFAKYFFENISISDNTVLFFICVEKGNHWREILSFGDIHKTLTSSRLANIQDVVTPHLTAGRYHTAIKTYHKEVADYIVKGEPYLFKIIAHLVIVLISCSIGYFIVHHLIKTAGGVVTVCHKTYSADSSKVTNRGDIYTHTTKTRTKIESSRSSSGGGGGSSRGGGGRF